MQLSFSPARSMRKTPAKKSVKYACWGKRESRRPSEGRLPSPRARFGRRAGGLRQAMCYGERAEAAFSNSPIASGSSNIPRRQMRTDDSLQHDHAGGGVCICMYLHTGEGRMEEGGREQDNKPYTRGQSGEEANPPGFKASASFNDQRTHKVRSRS